MSKLTRHLTVRLHSFWHIGSGRGEYAASDASVLRNAAGLPTLPGRTLKGLLRSGMEQAAACGAVNPDHIVEWFGSPIAATDNGDSGDATEQSLEEGRFRTKAGQLWFGSADLSQEWQSWARTGSTAASIVAELTRYVASTSIGQDGIAKDHTLRVREVAVPMTLIATITGTADRPEWVQDLEATLPLVRSLGTRRSRGYGRVAMTLEGGQ